MNKLNPENTKGDKGNERERKRKQKTPTLASTPPISNHPHHSEDALAITQTLKLELK